MTLEALYPLADRAVLYAALRREALERATSALGENRWDVDLEARTVTFSALADPARRLVASAELVATLAPASSSLLWGWAHPQGDPEGSVSRLREHGVEAGIDVLTQPEVPFPSGAAIQPEKWIDDAARMVALVAVELTRTSPAFVAPVGGSTRAVFLLDVALPPLTVIDAVAALPRLLGSTSLRDGRTAVWGLARLADWRLEWTDAAFTGVRVTDGTSSARFSFDEDARIVGFHTEA